MRQIQFWTLSGSCLLVGILALAEIPLTLRLQAANRELRGMNLLIQHGEESQALWLKLAARAYELGQQDPALKEVLSRLQINITPRPAANTPAPPVAAPPPAPATTPPPKPAKTTLKPAKNSAKATGASPATPSANP